MLFNMPAFSALADTTDIPLTQSGQQDEADIDQIISEGIAICSNYLDAQLTLYHEDGGITYGFEWYIIAMLRAGKSVNTDILDEYYQSVEAEVKSWTSDAKPTDIERSALTLTAMGKDITNVDGVDLAQLICNSSKLTDGSNELAYALLALDAADVSIPSDASWSRDAIITELLKFQLPDGSFGLEDAISGDTDMTAICVQALAPYKDKDAVAQSVNRAIGYLKGSISAGFNYADNCNTTAQVLLALASLGIDVTDSENGFGDGYLNIITALDEYRSSDASGYLYEDRINSMATVQVMMAYDAYRKAHKEGISYWDFSTAGADYDDKISDSDGDIGSDVNIAPPATVYVTIASDGRVVQDKNGGYVAQAAVKVCDHDKDGILTVDDALFAAHEACYEGGAAAGYSSYPGVHGLSLAILWGKGTAGTSAIAGYWLNNASCWSLADEVEEGDYLTAFNYCDSAGWSDAYSFFTQNEVSVASGNSITLNLRYISGYDAANGYAPIVSPLSGASVEFLDSDDSETLTTNSDGQVCISTAALSEGSYRVTAYKLDGSIVPCVCTINVSAPTPDTAPDDTIITVVPTPSYRPTPSKNPEQVTIETQVPDESTQTQASATFADIEKGSWYEKAADYAIANKLFNGISETEFAPHSEMTRAMLVTVIYRIENPQNPDPAHGFTDIADTSWYAESVAWAAQNGIISGVSETEFAPNSAITREQMATVIYRYAMLKGYTSTESSELDAFADADEISEYALDAFKWANAAGLINGVSETSISPKTSSTRAQVATILMRFCENIAK